MSTGQPNPIMNLVPLVLIFVIFYFMLIRPQKKQQQEHKKMLEGIAKNDEIVTSGGIHGTVINVKDKTVILRVDDNVKIEIDRQAIAYIKKPQSAASS
ncbi:MAG: preprotein translocase subunit YajC [Candidatus Omnitrophica bacterium]|nr:preprotein translocase subunit YajC [Candidatus Omnitrophota bacterium]